MLFMFFAIDVMGFQTFQVSGLIDRSVAKVLSETILSRRWELSFLHCEEQNGFAFESEIPQAPVPIRMVVWISVN